MREKDDLDLLLDSALSSYADAQADSGLEKRILARVTDARASLTNAPTPRRRWLAWAFALPMAACLVLLVFTVNKGPLPMTVQTTHSYQTRPDIRAIQNETSPAKHRDPVHRVMTRAAAASRGVDRVVAKPIARPKLNVFPTLAPLAPEEKALVEFSDRAPEAERRSLIEAQDQANAPLSIAAIHIAPITTPEEGKN
jgi:hypothetical protein